MKMVPHHKVHRFLVSSVCLLAIGLLLAGCYRKPTYTPPETYPVTGKVVSPAGKLPTGSLIKFVPPDGRLAGEGIIQADGSFTLKTLFHEEWLAGWRGRGQQSQRANPGAIGSGSLGWPDDRRQAEIFY